MSYHGLHQAVDDLMHVLGYRSPSEYTQHLSEDPQGLGRLLLQKARESEE
jgi:hypothetical protein